MHLPILIFIALHSANEIELTRVSRQIKGFTNTFNNFLQSDFKPSDPVYYPGDPNKVNIVYKPVEQPIQIERTIRVPVVKHVPQPVPVYIAQPYPVEKKVFVPYKVYEKQPVPIIHRYPVEKIIRVPVQVPVEQPIGILVPYHIPAEKHVAIPMPIYSPRLSSLLKNIPFTVKDSIILPTPDTVKFPDNAIHKSSVPDEEENSVSPSSLSPLPYNAENVIPFGTRLSKQNTAKAVEKEEHFIKESAQNSAQVQVITPAPKVATHEGSEELMTVQNNSEEIKSSNDKNDEVEDNKIQTHKIVFPTERNDIDDKS